MEKNQLVILGNGFDLACGLKSKYIDFFTDRFGSIFQNYNLKQDYNSFFNNCIVPFLLRIYKDREYTFWDIFFFQEKYNLKNKNWTSIEEAIEKIVSYIFFPQEGWPQDYSQKSENLIRMIDKHLKTHAISEQLCVKDVYQQFYLKELKEFEKTFEKYIGEQKRILKIGDRVINKKSDNAIYFENVEKKLRVILDNNYQNRYIFSFNYTINKWEEIIRDNFSTGQSKSISNIITIHGYVPTKKDTTYEGFHKKIIFGIDGSIIKDVNDPRIPFTKDYRVLENENYYELPQNISRIDFYGQSFGKADYSYFEAIFDIYKIQDLNVCLNFYYGTYETNTNNRNSRLKQQQINKARSLITDYGNVIQYGNLFQQLCKNKKIKFISDRGAMK